MHAFVQRGLPLTEVDLSGNDTVSDELRQRIEQLLTANAVPPDEAYAHARLSVRAALLGCVSAGKSTLLNAILNRRLSDTKIKRTTMLPQVYLESEGGACEASVQQILEANRDANEAILTGKRPLTDETCRSMYHHVPKLYDILDLPEGVRLDLLDVPGLNDAKTAGVYYAYLDREYPFLDVILLVVDIEEGFNTENSVQILDRIAANARKYPHRKVNVCVVANKCDDMEEEAESGELKCTDEELDEMFHQVLQTVRAKLTDLQHLEYEILRLSAEDSFVYRSFQQNPSLEELEPKLRNRLGVNEFGKRQWNRWAQAERDAQLRTYLADGDMDEALKLCGFNAFRAYLNQAIDGNRQYDIALTVFEYRLSRFSTLRSHKQLQAAALAYAEQAAAAARIDATYATRCDEGGEVVTDRTVKTVVDHFARAVEGMWTTEGEGLAVDSEAAATHAEALKSALAAHAGSLVAPFEAVAATLGKLVSRLETRLCEWYASRLLTDETYQVEGSAGWTGLVDLHTKLKAHRYDDDEFATLLPEVHALILGSMECLSDTTDAHPVVTYCTTMVALLPQLPNQLWSTLVTEHVTILPIEDDESATHAESLKVVLAEHKGPLTAPFEVAADVVGKRLCEWYASRLLADETYRVEGSAGWTGLVDLCAKLKAHRYGDDEFATLLPEVHARIVTMKCLSGVHGIGTADAHPVVTYCKAMATLLPQVAAQTWFALATGYLHTLVALDPPERFDLHFYVFRTLVARESVRLDTHALSEAFEGYLLSLQCVNACELSRLSFEWQVEVKTHARAIKAFSRAEKRQILSLYAFVLELGEVAENTDGTWEAMYEEVTAPADKLKAEAKAETDRHRMVEEAERRVAEQQAAKARALEKAAKAQEREKAREVAQAKEAEMARQLAQLRADYEREAKRASTVVTFPSTTTDTSVETLMRLEAHRVKSVTMSGCNSVTSTGLRAIARYCSQLEHLHLADMKPDATVLVEVMTASKDSLVALELIGCELGPRGAAILAPALARFVVLCLRVGLLSL